MALSNVDEVIALIKAAPTPAVAKEGLMSRLWRSATGGGNARPRFGRREGLPARGAGAGIWLVADGYHLSDAQAQAILELRLQRLTGLEQDKIVGEYKEIMEKIADLLDILAKPERITTIITDELAAMKQQFGDKRRSEIVINTQDLSMEDLIASEDVVVTLSHNGLYQIAAAG